MTSIQVQNHLWITLADGCRLGARLWLPEGAETAPVPAILEYIPYRKGDGTRARDEPMHGYVAQQGYAVIRVDMRGSGESDGHLADEYLQLEQDDALEVIAWIAEQRWCDGKVGMMGKSWGGFNALQVAARNPPALKAIMTAYSTDNRYTDDIHYMGGCLLNDNLWWGSIMLAYQSRSPDPAVRGEDWRARWLERIETLPFFPGLWMAHQHYDEYWKHGSVCEDYAAIQCPTLIVGGWVDSYTNAVPRLLAKLTAPARAIIGPWGHVYPQDGVPGPAIGFLQEMARWWDHWLKGVENGVMDEPAMRAFLQDPMPPEGTRAMASGRWVGEAEWPSPAVESRFLPLQADGGLALDADVAGVGALRICSPQSHGRAGGEWMGVGCPGEMPTDQRMDDGFALVFDTPVLAEEMAVLGAPVFHVKLSSDKAVAHLVLRLSDVAPDGKVSRVSYQVFNLAHRHGHDRPEALEPGVVYPVRVALNACGHRFMPGHRIRLSVATVYWPLIWPAPEVATLTLEMDGAALELPVRAGGAALDDAVHFPPPAHGPMTPMTQIGEGVLQRYSQYDAITGVSTYITDAVGGVFGEGVMRFDEIDTTVGHSLRRELSIRDDDPLSARNVVTQEFVLDRVGWHTVVSTRVEMTCDIDTFYMTGTLEAREDGAVVAQREWRERWPRYWM